VDLWSLFRDIWLDERYCRHGINIHPGSTIIDIGANIGVFSVYAAFKGAARVYSFEPFPENNACLLRNSANSGFEKVITASCEAVLSMTGTNRLYLSDCDAGHLMFHKNISLDHVREFMDVPTVSLQDIFRRYQLDYCDLLKLDCEGAEYDILLKSPVALFERIQSITMEIHNNVPGVSPADIQTALDDRGFVCSCEMLGKTFGYLYATRKAKSVSI
jgi:FkbM family methyltransferase